MVLIYASVTCKSYSLYQSLCTCFGLINLYTVQHVRGSVSLIWIAKASPKFWFGGGTLNKISYMNSTQSAVCDPKFRKAQTIRGT